MVYRVLLNDGMHAEGLNLFEDAGIEYDTTKRSLDELVRDIEEFDAISVRSATKVTREVIEAGYNRNLKVIGRAGVGYDNIDVNAASEYGIPIMIAPHGITNAAAELTHEMMLDVSRNIPQSYESLRKGIWVKKKFQGVELSNKTLGVIGCGRIAQRLSQLVSGYPMKVIGYDKNIWEVKNRFPDSRIEYIPKEQVFKQADYVTIHTGGKDIVVGAKELSLMKPTAYLINSSRGANVDEQALYEALKLGKIAGVGLDVYVGEPKKDGEKFENKLRDLDNVVFSSHLGASTEEAQIKTSREMAEVIIDYLLEGKLSNAVNMGKDAGCIEGEKRSIYRLFVHHKDVPGAFGKIGDLLGEYGINIRENPSREIGEGKVTTVYLVHQEPGAGLLDKLNKLDVVLRARI